MIGALDLEDGGTIGRIVREHDLALKLRLVDRPFERGQPYALRIHGESGIHGRQRIVKTALRILELSQDGRGLDESRASLRVLGVDAEREAIGEFRIARVASGERDVALMDPRIDDPTLDRAGASGQEYSAEDESWRA